MVSAVVSVVVLDVVSGVVVVGVSVVVSAGVALVSTAMTGTETASEQQVHTVRRVGELREARERCAVVHEVVAMGKEEA